MSEEFGRFATWIGLLGPTVPWIDPDIVRAALEECGADFSNLTKVDMRNLAKYGSKARGKVIKKIWGARKIEINAWIQAQADTTKMPKLTPAKGQWRPNPSNVEGFKGFFYDLTAFAIRALSFPEFHDRTEARFYNYKKKKAMRRRIMIVGYNDNKPFAPASITMQFPGELLMQISIHR